MITRAYTQFAILAKLEAYDFQNPAAKRIAIFLAGAGKTIEPENIPEHLLEEICQAYEALPLKRRGFFVPIRRMEMQIKRRMILIWLP